MPRTTIDAVLTALQCDPGRPRVTWYGGDGERIELSGAVLANWVAKTANLLVEEYDAGPGTRVLLDLPPHWRTLVWAIAVWRVGACVVLPGPSDDPADVELVVTDRPADARTGDAPVVAVSLPALARRFAGALPAGTTDAASAVMTYGDVIGWVPAPDPSEDAITGDGPDVSHAALLTWATGSADAPDGARVLLTTEAADERAHATAALLRRALDVLRTAGSVVVVDATTTSALAEDPMRRTRLLAAERITADRRYE